MKTTFVLVFQSSNQQNPSTFYLVFFGPRDSAEFAAEIHIRCNPPASHVALTSQVSKFPPRTHNSTALTKFRYN